MSKRILSTLLVAAVAGAALVATASAAMVGIYRNDMETTAQRGELWKIAGTECKRGGSQRALRITVGKRTEDCAYKTPVAGRDLEIVATGRLLSGTPKAVQRRAFLGVELRAGGGSKYQLRVFPLQRKAQLVRFAEAGVDYYDIAKDVAAIKGVNKANKLRLRALNIRGGPEKGRTKIVGFVGTERLVEGVDALPAELVGEATAVTVGAPRNGSGVVASVDDVIVRTLVNF